MPALLSIDCVSWTGGSANGSFAIGYAAVFGRWLAGSDAIQLANGTISSTIGRLTSKTLCACWLAGAENTLGAPPAPSMNANPFLAATAEAGVVSNEENGPKVRSTWSVEIRVV